MKHPNANHHVQENMPKVVPSYREQAKKRIIEAASAEFAENGFRNTTMDDVADRIGVSKGAVYQYFPSKEELLGEIARAYLEKTIRAEVPPSKGHSLQKAIEEWFPRMLTTMPEWFPSLVSDVVSEANRDGHARELVSDFRKKLIESMQSVWEERKKAGEIPQEVDVRLLARALSGLHLGLIVQISCGLPRAEAAEAWSTVVRAMSDGLHPRKRSGH